MPTEPQTESYNQKDPSASASQSLPSSKGELLLPIISPHLVPACWCWLQLIKALFAGGVCGWRGGFPTDVCGNLFLLRFFFFPFLALGEFLGNMHCIISAYLKLLKLFFHECRK